MKIYTGQTTGIKLEIIKSLDLGICISSSPVATPNKQFGNVDCILDNGAFACWQKGYPFQQDVFLSTMAQAYKCNINLDFIVCPDIVTGGKKSLDFSISWMDNEFLTAQRLALAVQDGMTHEYVGMNCNLERLTHIFIGGSKEWKWETAKDWVEFAHENNLKCHIGRCGTFENLKKAYEYGADSVDSTNFTRNNNWDAIKLFYAYLGKEWLIQEEFNFKEGTTVANG